MSGGACPTSGQAQKSPAAQAAGPTGDTHQRKIVVLYFRPSLIAFSRVELLSSPLNSQKNAPPRPLFFT